jgi:hypothetical protein
MFLVGYALVGVPLVLKAALAVGSLLLDSIDSIFLMFRCGGPRSPRTPPWVGVPLGCPDGRIVHEKN